MIKNCLHLKFCLILLMLVQPLMIYAQSIPTQRNMLESNNQQIKSFAGQGRSATIKLSEDIKLSPIPLTGLNELDGNYYSVHILGNVARPGIYRILPSDRVTDAIKYAGGIMSNGSERLLELRRGDRVQILDIYSYKFFGNLAQNPYLIENDVIFIPLKKGEIQIEGPVNRPGNYELNKPIKLEKAIQLAGGFSSGVSHTEPLRVIRFDAQGKKEIIALSKSDQVYQEFTIKKGDILVVPHILTEGKKFDYNVSRIPGDNIFYPTINDNVNVIGAVTASGAYPFQPSFHYRDYIGLAGPTNLASIKRTKVIGADDKTRRVSRVKEINPGDTIVVPSKAITTSNFLMVFNTLTNMFLTTIAVKNNFE